MHRPCTQSVCCTLKEAMETDAFMYLFGKLRTWMMVRCLLVFLVDVWVCIDVNLTHAE